MLLRVSQIAAIALVSIFSVIGQADTIHPGVQLFEQGKFAEAIQVLSKAKDEEKYKNDAAIFNFLGASYVNTGDFKNAQKYLARAVKLHPENVLFRNNLAYIYLRTQQVSKARSEAKRVVATDPRNVTAHVMLANAGLLEGKLADAERSARTAIEIDPKYPMGYVLASESLIARFGTEADGDEPKPENIDLLKQAKDLLEVGIARCKPDTKRLEEELETVVAFHSYFANRKHGKPTSPLPREVVTPGDSNLKIISKPRPSFSDAARIASKSGTVKVAVLFAANGKIESMLVIDRLGYGLDEQALRAARQIRFEPKVENGKPVSVVRIIEYTFEVR